MPYTYLSKINERHINSRPENKKTEYKLRKGWGEKINHMYGNTVMLYEYEPLT